MRRRNLGTAFALLMACALALPCGCSARPYQGERLMVAVTLLPQAAFVEAVGGDLVDVVVMVPPGASPHTYEVSPDQMVALSKAKMYAKVGSPVEFELVWMDRLMQSNRDMIVVDCSDGIQLMEVEEHGDEDDHEHEEHHEDGHVHVGADPHIWLSVRNAQMMVQNICDGLVEVDPANADYYRKNSAEYNAELQALDDELRGALAGLERRRFIVFHPAFGYFARDYELVQIAVEQGGSEPDARYMIRLIDEAREHGIRVVFAAPQFSLRSAEVIAAEIGGEVVIVDPLARDYLSNMRAIGRAMQKVT